MRKAEDFKGLRYYRTKDNPREKAFADEWIRENIGSQGRGNQPATVDYLTDDTPAKERGRTYWPPPATERDCKIAGMIIQWLGSNVGWSFLELALKRLGLKIVEDSEATPAAAQDG